MRSLQSLAWQLAVAAALLSACSQSGHSAASKTIRIGIDLPLSGADASVGQSTLNGMVLAIEQADAKGLPDGFVLKAYPLDDTVQGIHNPQQGVANIRTFVSNTDVLAVLGPYNSNVAAAEIPITNAAGLAQIAPSVVADELTLGPAAVALRRVHPKTNAFFRVCTTDSRQGSVAARFARSLGFKRVYIIDDNETYGLDIARVFAHDFTALGGKVIGHDHLAADTQDFRALLLKVAAAKPDLVFFGGVTSTGGGLLRKQMFAVGLGRVPFMGGDGIADLATVAGKYADGTYFTVAAPDVTKLPSARSFVVAYHKRFHQALGAYSANGYAAAQVAIAAIASALKRDGGAFPTRTAVLRYVAATKDLATPIGPITFDAAGDMKNPVLSLYTFKNAKPVFIKLFKLKTQ
ncbi:MAG: branched-chain amino acid ABC transporter substrate-binding protein [Vulcanimicrobiaceae bacterium]